MINNKTLKGKAMGGAEQLLKLIGAISLVVSGVLFYFLAGESTIAKVVGILVCCSAIILTADALFFTGKKAK